MSTAAAGGIKAQPALRATNPATHPLAHNDASGLPKRARVMTAAASAAAIAARVVFMATRSARAESTPVEQNRARTIQPIHPIHARKHPKIVVRRCGRESPPAWLRSEFAAAGAEYPGDAQEPSTRRGLNRAGASGIHEASSDPVVWPSCASHPRPTPSARIADTSSPRA